MRPCLKQTAKLFVLSCAEKQIQGLEHARQELYHLGVPLYFGCWDRCTAMSSRPAWAAEILIPCLNKQNKTLSLMCEVCLCVCALYVNTCVCYYLWLQLNCRNEQSQTVWMTLIHRDLPVCLPSAEAEDVYYWDRQGYTGKTLKNHTHAKKAILFICLTTVQGHSWTCLEHSRAWNKTPALTNLTIY